MFSRIAVLVVGLALLAGCQEGASEEPERAFGCPAVEIFGLRGQGQSVQAHDGMGAEVEQISEALMDRIDADMVRMTAIEHESRLGSWDEYLEDVRDGRERLRHEIRSVAAMCRDTKIAVIGFSQGAQIAREELADPRIGRDVDLLVMVGSPSHDPSSPFHHVELPGDAVTAAGRLGPGPDLGELSERTVEACVAGDAVCAKGSSPDDTIHRTAYEERDVVDAIASAAADVLNC